MLLLATETVRGRRWANQPLVWFGRVRATLGGPVFRLPFHNGHSPATPGTPSSIKHVWVFSLEGPHHDLRSSSSSSSSSWRPSAGGTETQPGWMRCTLQLTIAAGWPGTRRNHSGDQRQRRPARPRRGGRGHGIYLDKPSEPVANPPTTGPQGSRRCGDGGRAG